MKVTKGFFTLNLVVILGLLLVSTNTCTQLTHTWTKLTDTTPFNIIGYANTAVYDSESERLLFFDKGDATYDLVNTWAFDYSLGSWSNISSSGFIRQAAPVAYDSESDRAILFGGNRYHATILGEYVYHTDTWAYDFNSNT